MPLEELRQFRQWGSKTPGHPEHGLTPGVEASTGPLGHGFAMGVGFAIAESMLAARYNRQNFPIVDHYTYGLVSDGDLMEGVSCEAASLAGTLGLGKLIYLYDDNKITIEGSTELAFSEDVEGRFKAYGWQVLRVADAEDVQALAAAVECARAEKSRPSLVIVRTHIGYGSPKQDSPSCHGEPLGAEALAAAKAKAGWPAEPMFYVPDRVREHFDAKKSACAQAQQKWAQLLADYRAAYPEAAGELERRLSGPAAVDVSTLENIFQNTAKTATREASGEILQALAEQLPELAGGSADLGPSTKTIMKNGGFYSRTEPAGRNIHFGVREHAMGAVVNGMALHGGFLPFASTFLVFADFLRPAIRMAALMGLRSVFVLTHDSIALGEDGPTHQPVETAMALRIMPNVSVIRPADALETAVAWQQACLNTDGPTCLLLSRQKLPVLHTYRELIHSNACRGAYVLSPAQAKPLAVLIGTGSEVHLALAAQAALAREGVDVSVVSMPSWEAFDKQDREYRESVLPPSAVKIALEAGVPCGWSRYTGNEDQVTGISTFGASAPGDILMEKYGFTVANVVAKVKAVL